MDQKPDIQRLIAFQAFLLEFRAIKRAIFIPGQAVEHENDVDHSYSLAMMAWFLAEYFPELNRDKLIRIALAHDLVEVHAGDTFAFGDAESLASKHDREMAALAKLKQDWPEMKDIFVDIEDYESKTSAEAQFIYALDKLMPMLMNYLGKGYTWVANNVTLAQVRAEKEKKISSDTPIYDYYMKMLTILEAKPEFFANAPSQQG